MAASWSSIGIQLQRAAISKADKHYLHFLVSCLMEETQCFSKHSYFDGEMDSERCHMMANCVIREKCISLWLQTNILFQSPFYCYQPSGKGPRLPEVYCVISRLGCFDLFSKVRRFLMWVFTETHPQWWTRREEFLPLMGDNSILQLLFWIFHPYYWVHQRMSYSFCGWGRTLFKKHLGVCMIWLTEGFSIVF